MAQLVTNPPAMQETLVRSLSWEDPLEKGKATHSSIPAWRIPGLYSPWRCKESDTTERLSLTPILLSILTHNYLINIKFLFIIITIHSANILVSMMSYPSIWASQVALTVKNPLANAGDISNTSSVSGSGKYPAGGHGNPLQYSCLQNSMDREAWWVTVHGVAKSWT